MFLHSEVLRYSSSASTIRPLFEYLFTPISGYDIGSCCPYCPNHRLDPLGHHALTCKHGGDVVLRHNSLRDVFVESCHRTCLGGQVEVGSGLGLDRLHSRPAEYLSTTGTLANLLLLTSLSLHRLTQSL